MSKTIKNAKTQKTQKTSKTIKTLAVILCLAMFVGVFAGCTVGGDGLGKIKVPSTTGAKETGTPKPSETPNVVETGDPGTPSPTPAHDTPTPTPDTPPPTPTPTPTPTPPTPTNNNNNAGELGKVGNLTAEILRIYRSGTYHMKTEDIYGGPSVEYYIKNGATAVLFTNDDGTYRIIIMGGKSYVIMDEYEIIYVQDAAEYATGNFEFAANDLAYIGEDSDYFNGSTYKCDIYAKYDERGRDTGERVYFFVDNGTFKGMRLEDGDDISEAVVTAFDTNIPDSIFEFPDYQFVNG